MKLKDVKAKINADTYSQKDGVFTLRWGYFYRFGRATETYINLIKTTFPSAVILESGDIWKPFRGGASIVNSSHWFVKFSIPEVKDV